MQLIPCQPPSGSLESAPRSSLRADSEHERWEGFWCDDERYYARCTHPDGSVQWYRMEDERGVLQFRPQTASLRFTSDVGRQTSHVEAHTRNAAGHGRTMIVSTRADGRAMLVGTWQRTPRRARVR